MSKKQDPGTDVSREAFRQAMRRYQEFTKNYQTNGRGSFCRSILKKSYSIYGEDIAIAGWEGDHFHLSTIPSSPLHVVFLPLLLHVYCQGGFLLLPNQLMLQPVIVRDEVPSALGMLLGNAWSMPLPAST